MNSGKAKARLTVMVFNPALGIAFDSSEIRRRLFAVTGMEASGDLYAPQVGRRSGQGSKKGNRVGAVFAPPGTEFLAR